MTPPLRNCQWRQDTETVISTYYDKNSDRDVYTDIWKYKGRALNPAGREVVRKDFLEEVTSELGLERRIVINRKREGEHALDWLRELYGKSPEM